MKGYFFNAQPTEDSVNYPSGYDRTYDAVDLNRYMGAFFTNGVFVQGDADACKVTANGLKLTVHPGIITVNGGQCHFEAGDGLTLEGAGKYSVMCRMDSSVDVRAFRLLAVKGDSFPAPVRSGDIYDMCLAHVTATVSSATVTDTRGDRALCGYAELTGQPPYYPPDSDSLPYVLWLYTMGFPMDAAQKKAVEGNASLMGIFNGSRTALSEDPHWRRIATFETAGARTWTAPDLFGGKNYEIGVWMCGGGGAGGVIATAWDNQSKFYLVASGGASGRARALKMIVTPGRTYNLVVGAGGAKITFTTNQSDGNNGGSTSFYGVTVDGGEGGKHESSSINDYGSVDARAAIGAQCSIGITSGYNSNIMFCSLNPFGGVLTPHTLGEASGSPVYGSTNLGMVGFPNECFDPFAVKQMLGCGGGVYMVTGEGENGLFPHGTDPISGLGGGRASGTDGVSAGSATAPGCGGGAFALHQRGTHASAGNGAGAAGAVYIYARRAV